MQNQVFIGVVVAYEQTDGKLDVKQIPQALNGMYKLQLLYPNTNEVVSGIPLSLLPHANNFSQYSYVSYKVGDKVYLLHLYENVYLMLGSAGNVADTDLWHNKHILHNSMFGNEISVIEPYLDAQQYSSGMIINTNNIFIGTGQLIMPSSLNFKTINLSFDEFVSNTLHPLLSNLYKYNFDAKNIKDAIVNAINNQSNTYIQVTIPEQTIYLGSVYYNYSLIPSSRNLTIGLQSIFKKDKFSSQTIFSHANNKLSNAFLYNIDAHHYVNNIYDIHKYSNINTTYVYYTHNNNENNKLYTKNNFASENSSINDTKIDASNFVWQPSTYKSYKVIETEQRFSDPIPTKYYSIQTFSLTPLVNSEQILKTDLEKFEQSTYTNNKLTKVIKPLSNNSFDYYYTVKHNSTTQTSQQLRTEILKILGKYKSNFGRDSFAYYETEQLTENNYTKQIFIGSTRGDETSYKTNTDYTKPDSNVLQININGSTNSGGSYEIICLDGASKAIIKITPSNISLNVQDNGSNASINIFPQLIEINANNFKVNSSNIILNGTAYINNAQIQSIAWNSAVGTPVSPGGASGAPDVSANVSTSPKIPSFANGLNIPLSITTKPGIITEALTEYTKTQKPIIQTAFNNILFNTQKSFNDVLSCLLTTSGIPNNLFSMVCNFSAIVPMIFGSILQVLNMLSDLSPAFFANAIAFITQIANFITNIINQFKALIQKLIDLITPFLGALCNIINAITNLIFGGLNALISLLTRIINSILEFINNALFALVLPFTGFFTMLSSLLQAIALTGLLLACLGAGQKASDIANKLIMPPPISISSYNPIIPYPGIPVTPNPNNPVPTYPSYTLPNTSAINPNISNTDYYTTINNAINNNYKSSFTSSIANVDPSLLVNNLLSMTGVYNTIQPLINNSLTDTDKQLANNASSSLQNALDAINKDINLMFDELFKTIDLFKHCG